MSIDTGTSTEVIPFSDGNAGFVQQYVTDITETVKLYLNEGDDTNGMRTGRISTLIEDAKSREMVETTERGVEPGYTKQLRVQLLTSIGTALNIAVQGSNLNASIPPERKNEILVLSSDAYLAAISVAQGHSVVDEKV